MQDGAHTGLGARWKHCFSYFLYHKLSKMYSFHTLCYLQAEILTKTCFMVAICKQMQDGGRIGLGANVNIVFFLIAYITSFPNMYSFHTFQKYLAEIFTKTCFMAAILNKMQDGGHIGVGANVNIVFLNAYVISFPKMYSFHTLQKIPTKVLIQT